MFMKKPSCHCSRSFQSSTVGWINNEYDSNKWRLICHFEILNRASYVHVLVSDNNCTLWSMSKRPPSSNQPLLQVALISSCFSGIVESLEGVPLAAVYWKVCDDLSTLALLSLRSRVPATASPTLYIHALQHPHPKFLSGKKFNELRVWHTLSQNAWPVSGTFSVNTGLRNAQSLKKKIRKCVEIRLSSPTLMSSINRYNSL